jgi:hypothetical protein
MKPIANKIKDIL